MNTMLQKLGPRLPSAPSPPSVTAWTVRVGGVAEARSEQEKQGPGGQGSALTRCQAPGALILLCSLQLCDLRQVISPL